MLFMNVLLNVHIDYNDLLVLEVALTPVEAPYQQKMLLACRMLFRINIRMFFRAKKKNKIQIDQFAKP